MEMPVFRPPSNTILPTMATTATMKDSVIDSGGGRTESEPPREMKRCSMKMCQTEVQGEGGTRQGKHVQRHWAISSWILDTH